MKKEKSNTIQAQIVRASPESLLDKIRKEEYFVKSDYGYVIGYHFTNQYIGNTISQSHINNLNCRSPIGIFSQTGTGKSSLVFDKILKTVK